MSIESGELAGIKHPLAAYPDVANLIPPDDINEMRYHIVAWGMLPTSEIDGDKVGLFSPLE